MRGEGEEKMRKKGEKGKGEKLTIGDFINYGLHEIFEINTYYNRVFENYAFNALIDVIDWLIAARRAGKVFQLKTEGMRVYIDGVQLIELRLRRKGVIKHQNIEPLKKLFTNKSELEIVKKEYERVKKEKAVIDVDEKYRKEVQKRTKKGGIARIFTWTEDGWKEETEKSPVCGADIDFRKFSHSFGFSEHFNAFVGQYWVWDRLYAAVFEFENRDELVAQFLIEKV